MHDETTQQPAAQEPSHGDETRPPGSDATEPGFKGRQSFLKSLQRQQTRLQSYEEPCEIHLSSRAFALSWVFVLLVHATLAVFYYYVVWLHQYLKTDRMKDFVLYLTAELFNFFDAIIVANWIICCSHIYAILCAVGYSLYYRQLVFGRRRGGLQVTDTASSAAHWWCFGRFQALKWLVEALKRGLTTGKICFSVVCGRRGLFGVEGQYFERVFLLREFIEIALQTYQAWKLSNYVASIWVNRSFVLIIVVNCWSTPLVHYLFRSKHHESFKKVGCLLLDMNLDILSSIVVPLVIFLPYARQFDVAYGDFPLLSYYKDTWFINAVAENRQVFVMSWLDFVSKTFPGYTLLSSLRSIKASLPPPTQLKSVSPAAEAKTPMPLKQSFPIKSVERMDSTSPTESSTRTQSTIRMSVMSLVQPQWRREGKRIELLMILWGIGVTAIHLHSSTVAWRGEISSCLLEQRPWVATRYSCVVMEINCVFTEKFSGLSMDIDATLVGLEPEMLKSLIFSCCPELEMPPQLQSLSALETIKIYNSTIKEWNSSAALTASTHPLIQFLYLVDVNLSGIPEGLLSREFPPTLVDVEFCGSNLTSLPDDLYDFWSSVDYLVLENSPSMRAVPEALRRMRIRHLSLCSNAISTIPEYFFFGNQSIEALELAGNPISSLPDRDESLFSDPTALYAVSLGFTNVSELPKWMQQMSEQPLSDVLLKISAGETPLCRTGDTGSGATSGPANEFVVVDCTVDDGLPIKLLYPVEAEHQWRKESWSTAE